MEYVQVSLELSLSSLDYGKQAVIDDGKENCKGGESNEIENNGCCLTFDVWKRSSSELLVGESRSHADQYQRESLKHNNNAAGLSGTVSLQLSLGTTAKKRERMEKPSCGSSTTTRKLVTEDDNIIKENSQGAGDDVVSSYNATTSTTTAATSTAIDRDKGKKYYFLMIITLPIILAFPRREKEWRNQLQGKLDRHRTREANSSKTGVMIIRRLFMT